MRQRFDRGHKNLVFNLFPGVVATLVYMQWGLQHVLVLMYETTLQHLDKNTRKSEKVFKSKTDFESSQRDCSFWDVF